MKAVIIARHCADLRLRGLPLDPQGEQYVSGVEKMMLADLRQGGVEIPADLSFAV